eukprot:4076487-Lingulodinium_polyedra.AAC.1
MDKARCNVAKLRKHKDLLAALRELQPNMSYTPLTMKRALWEVAEAKKETWAFTMADMEDFSSRVSARIRTMARHCQQALRKPCPPAWARVMFGITAEPVEDAATLQEETQSQTQELEESQGVEWFFGYNSEYCTAWRVLSTASSTKHAEH